MPPGNTHNSDDEGTSNRLSREKSPYLLEHANNPVDWYPWGREAFTKAKRENKPIFLSIGYSSCHWCHVMRHESFEDPEIAKLMNDSFVSIKVDREERPDVDEIYMKSVVAITGSGGWPLSVFLTPSLEPFYGGTYFPPTPRYGMPSFSNVLRSISQSWKSDRKKLVESASQLKSSIKDMYEMKKAVDSSLTDSIFLDTFNELAGSFDSQYGGFGSAPKFPSPSNLFFLTRYYSAKRSNLSLTIVSKTLDSMMHGGIYDQVGGGFHRYSTDRYWLVPHFEKMLYDNALLIWAYCEGFLLTGNKEYKRVVEEISEWVLREMQNAEGGFFAAQDADSPEGEGSYYVWTPDEMEKAFASSEKLRGKSDLVSNYFSLTRQGNFENGKTILTAKPLATLKTGQSEKENEQLLKEAKKVLLEFRDKRPKPFTDDKILTSWNGLMISALSKAFQVFGKEKYLVAGKKAADFVLEKLSSQNPEGKIHLLRRFRQGESKGAPVLEDYSFFVNGLLDLYEAGFDAKYLEVAFELGETMVSDFYDKIVGGFFQAPADTPDLIARAKDAFDGALPSGNSIAALVCLRLAEISSDAKWKDVARDTFLAFWDLIQKQPTSFTEMLVALQFYLGNPKEVVVSGELDSVEVKEFLKVLRHTFLPNSVILLASASVEKMSPLVAERLPVEGGKPKVFVCSNYTCKLPSTTKDELLAALEIGPISP